MGLYRLVVDLDEGVTEIGARELAEEIKQESLDVVSVEVQRVD